MKKNSKTVLFIINLLSLLLIILLAPWNSFAQIITEIGKTNPWREIRFDIITHSAPAWCASGRQLVLGGGDGEGIRLVDIYSGEIRRITNNIRHKNPSCSSDGRYIFFTDSQSGEYKNLYVYNARSKKVSSIYSLGKPLNMVMVYEPISPSGKYLIGPPNWKEIVTLPGGEPVLIVPIHGTIEIGKPIDYSQLAWSPDSSRLYLLNSYAQILSIRELDINKETNIKIRIKGFYAKRIKSSSDNTKLYIEAMSSDDMVTNLYELDLKKPMAAPKLLFNSINHFDLDLEDSIVFSRNKGEFNQLFIAKKGGEIELIKKFSFYAWPISPHVSRDGKAIVFLQKLPTDERIITVLAKDDK